MAKEIERKFLVTNPGFKTLSDGSVHISQAYLCRDIDRTVRVRIMGERGFITVKSRNHGMTRGEWEYEIPVDEALEMLSLCEHIISKRRWYVRYAGHTWEVDEFEAPHRGLTIAEVELGCEGETVEAPGFIGEEVTGNPRYYNSTLSAPADE